MSEIFDLYRKCFPFCIREEAAVKKILAGENVQTVENRDKNGVLRGVSVTEGNTVLLLCVDRPYRNQGIGSRLLAESEQVIRDAGYDTVAIGAGTHYIMPGVPSAVPVFRESLQPDQVYEGLEDHTDFFRKRGYIHRWDCNCFDMRLDLREFSASAALSDGITFRFADETDLPAVVDCVEDAHESFAKYYRIPALYTGESSQRVFLAENGDTVLGTLIVSLETEGPGLGSVGCTAVRHSWRGRAIASRLVILGTGYLRDCGMKNAFLGYTYSGLDRLYGRAGYRICTYYFMAEKEMKKPAIN